VGGESRFVPSSAVTCPVFAQCSSLLLHCPLLPAVPGILPSGFEWLSGPPAHESYLLGGSPRSQLRLPHFIPSSWSLDSSGLWIWQQEGLQCPPTELCTFAKSQASSFRYPRVNPLPYRDTRRVLAESKKPPIPCRNKEFRGVVYIE